MKKLLVQCLMALTVLPLAQVACQNTPKNNDITVEQSLLKTAEIFRYNYTAELEKAKGGDYKALMDFLNFHRKLDGVDGLNHGLVCLELIPVVGDEHFAAAAQIFTPKMKALILERLVYGQQRTQNEALKKQLAEWAPHTWGELNNKPIGHGAEKEAAGIGVPKGNENTATTPAGTQAPTDKTPAPDTKKSPTPATDQSSGNKQ